MAGGTRTRPAILALGASLILNAVFLASLLARHPGAQQPTDLLGEQHESLAIDGTYNGLAGAPSTVSGAAGAGSSLRKDGTTQLADMYTAPLHLMKSLIDNALKGAGYGDKGTTKSKLKIVPVRAKTQLAADPAKASMNKELTAHKVVDSTGAFFDPSIKAFVNPLLLPHLPEMNELQAKVSSHKLSMLKSADRQIANPTSSGKPVAPADPKEEGLFQWGTVNPVNDVMRLDCTDSVMDASSNGAPMSRLWGSHHTKSDMVDACGPGDECRDACAYQMCNKGHQYTIECPPGCAARAGPVFGAGTSSNPFLDASSVCGAALAKGIARNDVPTILTLKIVEPVREYRGIVNSHSPIYEGAALAALHALGGDETARERTTLDFEWSEWQRAEDPTEASRLSGPRFQCCKGEGLHGTSRLGDYTAMAKYRQKWGGSSWFGVRAFTLENLVAVPGQLEAEALHGQPPAGSHTSALRSIGAGHMGAPFAPSKWDRARLGKLPVRAPTDAEIAGAGGLEAWERQQGLLERREETFAGKDVVRVSTLVDMPQAQSQSHLALSGKEGSLAVAPSGALVYNDGIWNQITVECWVRDLAISDSSGYVSAFNSDPKLGAHHFGFVLGTFKKQFAFGIGAGDNKEMDYVMAPDWLTMPNEGKWTHLAGTYDAEDGMKLYINGLFVGCAKTMSGPIEFPNKGAPQGSVDVVLGGLLGGLVDDATGAVSEGSSVKGALDEARIWSVVREQEDIFAMMHRTVADEFLGPLPEGLELYWRFDFDVINCNSEFDWLPCHYTCDEVRQYKAHMLTHDSKSPGVSLLPSDVPVETLSIARGCMKCPQYPDVEYATVSPKGVVGVGDHVEITCDEGFESRPLGDDGSVTPECKFDMDYTAGVECVAMCPSVAAPPHGSVDPAGDTEMFQWVTMSCDDGYKAVGNRYIMCRPNHEYLFDHGTCVATCPLYPHVEHGTVTRGECITGKCDKDVLFAGESVSIVCDEGFGLSFDSSSKATCGEGGEYDFPTAVCLPICSAHPPVEHGVVSVTGPTMFGDEVQITCDDNYELEHPEMASVTCGAEHTYSQPWLDKSQTRSEAHTGQFSRCLAICPPYPYVDFSTITVDGSWEAAANPVREGSKVQVTCRAGYTPGPYNGGSPTARCIDGGKGGVYDPPACSPLGGLDPKPIVGHSSCTPAVCIAPPPPPYVPPPPPKSLEAPKQAGDPGSGWGLNGRCADFRDYSFTWAQAKQVDYLEQCMAADCVQSLEGGNANKATELGCRYHDANGFCYHAGATQMWCKEHSGDERCIDGGAAWAIPKLGSAAGKPTAWMPVANYPLRGAAKASGQVVTCSCMKNCACLYQNKKWKCFCSNPDTVAVGGGEWEIDQILRASKDGECTCMCAAGAAVTAEPVKIDMGVEDGSKVQEVVVMAPPV